MRVIIRMISAMRKAKFDWINLESKRAVTVPIFCTSQNNPCRYSRLLSSVTLAGSANVTIRMLAKLRASKTIPIIKRDFELINNAISARIAVAYER